MLFIPGCKNKLIAHHALEVSKIIKLAPIVLNITISTCKLVLWQSFINDTFLLEYEN